MIEISIFFARLWGSFFIIFGLLFSFNIYAVAELPKTPGQAWETLKEMTKLIPQEMKKAFPEVLDVFKSMFNWVKGMYNKHLARTIGDLWDFLKDQFKSRVDIFKTEFKKEWELLKLDIKNLFRKPQTS